MELSLRAYAEGGSSSPTPYVEGWYVARPPAPGGRGGTEQVAVAWCREHGHAELGSDTLAANRLGRRAHRALGFEEVETLVVFRREL